MPKIEAPKTGSELEHFIIAHFDLYSKFSLFTF